MTDSPILFILIVLASVLGFEAIRSFFQGRPKQERARSRQRLRSLALPQKGDGEGEASLLRHGSGGASPLRTLIAQLPIVATLQLCLYRSGMLLSLERFALMSLGAAVGGVIVANAFLTIPGATLIGLTAGVLPFLHVLRLGRKRTAAFEQQFPDALDLLIRALKAGHALSVGLQMVGDELPDPVGSEFALVADEIQMGMDVRTALSNLADRVNAPDLPFFVVAVTLQQETGSNLAELLNNLSSLIRERFKIYGKIQSLTAMGRASANLLLVWPFVMTGAMYAARPDYVRPLWETQSGHSMVILSGILIVVGYIVCRRMATIEV